MTPAKRVLSDPDASGLAYLRAVEKLTAGACLAWELETTFEVLEDSGIFLSEASAERLIAALAVQANPSHLWDVSVFKSLCEAFNGRVSSPNVYFPCSVPEAAWAVCEASMLLEHYDRHSAPGYGDEPCLYVAAVAATDGWVLLPEELSFAQEHLTRMPGCGEEEALASQLRALVGVPLGDAFDPESPLDVHRAKLAESSQYVASKRQKLTSYLDLLESKHPQSVST